MKRIGRALYQTFNLPTDPTKEPTENVLKSDIRKLVLDNSECVAGLTLAFTTTHLMEFVVHSESPQYPEGVAKDIV